MSARHDQHRMNANACTQAYIRRKVRVVDRGEFLQIKVPFPLPLAWGRTVIPYAPKGVKPPLPHTAETDAQDAAPSRDEPAPAGRLLQVDSLAGPRLTSLLKQDFQVWAACICRKLRSMQRRQCQCMKSQLPAHPSGCVMPGLLWTGAARHELTQMLQPLSRPASASCRCRKYAESEASM